MKAVFKISYYLRRTTKTKKEMSDYDSLNGKMCTVGSSGLSVNPDKWDNKLYRMNSKTLKGGGKNKKGDRSLLKINYYAAYEKI